MLTDACKTVSLNVAGVDASESVYSRRPHCARAGDSGVSRKTGGVGAACSHCTDVASEGSRGIPH